MAGERVLIVNPMKEVRRAVADSLVERYDVAQAASGREALGLLETGPLPSAVLIDFLLPDLEAEEFLTGMKENPRLARVPVIAMTGLARRAGAESADAELRRPFGASDLQDVLARLGGG